jgi:hypothetical protein
MASPRVYLVPPTTPWGSRLVSLLDLRQNTRHFDNLETAVGALDMAPALVGFVPIPAPREQNFKSSVQASVLVGPKQVLMVRIFLYRQ